MNNAQFNVVKQVLQSSNIVYCRKFVAKFRNMMNIKYWDLRNSDTLEAVEVAELDTVLAQINALLDKHITMDDLVNCKYVAI